MKSLIKNNIGEIISFILTISIFLVVLGISGLFDKSIMISDLNAQMYPLLEHIKSGSIALYDFSLGIGDNVLGLIYYYLLSPFNLLSLFIKDNNTFFMTIIVLKSAFSAVFCYKYLKYQFTKEKKIIFMLFSLLYALSSYYVSYNMVVQFLDVYMLFPLILLGIDKIIKEDKYLLYILSLMMIIVSNYYFAYMICIFVFIYFNYKNIINDKKNIVKNNIKFICVSALTCFSMSFIFLPVFLELGSYSRGTTGLFGGEPFELLFTLRSIFEHYLIGNMKIISVINPFGFYIYTSIIVFPLMYFYFINNKIKLKEKISTGVILLILILSIGFNYFNYMWHGFSVPCGFNGRFTFMFILFIIMICTKSIYYIKEFKIKHYIIIFSSIFFFIGLYSIILFPRLFDINILFSFFLIYMFTVINSLLFKKCDFKIKEYLIVLVILISTYGLGSLVFGFDVFDLLKLLGIYVCVMLFHIINRDRDLKLKHFLILFLLILIPLCLYSISSNIVLLEKCTIVMLFILLGYIVLLRFIPKYKWVNILLILLVIYELGYNAYGYLFRFPYNDVLEESYNDVIDYIRDYDDSVFYRIEDNNSAQYINSSILNNYYGIDYFMSTIKEDYVNFFRNLGVKNYDTSNNSLNYDGSYHLISSLLGVKYYIDYYDIENDYYKKIDRVSNHDIYINDNSLSLGYMVNSKIKDIEVSDNGLEYLNNIYKCISDNDKELLIKEDVSCINKKEYSFKNTSKKDFYLLIDLELYNINPEIYINGELLKNKNSTNMYYVKNKYDVDSTINITIETVNDSDKDLYDHIDGVYVSYYRDKTYIEDINILKKSMLDVTEVNNGIKGNIKVEEDGILFLSILYDKDLDVYVDGEKVEKIKLLDTFIGVELDKGNYKIEVKYKSNTLYVSFIPSVVSLVLLILYLRKIKET